MWQKEKFRTVKTFRYFQSPSSAATASTDDTSCTSIGDISLWVDTSNAYFNFSGVSSDLTATNGIMLSTMTKYPVNIHSTGILNMMTTSTQPRIQYIVWE